MPDSWQAMSRPQGADGVALPVQLSMDVATRPAQGMPRAGAGQPPRLAHLPVNAAEFLEPAAVPIGLGRVFLAPPLATLSVSSCRVGR